MGITYQYHQTGMNTYKYLSDPELSKLRLTILLAVVFALLVAVFLASPWPGGDDWETFHGAAQRVLDRDPLYGDLVTHAYYSNPAWFALLLAPFGLLPMRLGWAILSASTLIAGLALLRRWESHSGVIKPVLVLLSPPMIYTLLHGQIDTIIICAVFLPAEWWALAAFTKPQVTLGLLAGIPPTHWLRVVLVSGAVLAVTLVVFGLWPLDLIDQPTPFVDAGHNLWRGLWPFQVPAGVALIALGFSRKDERLLIAGSPLLSPYAAISTLVGPWIAAVTYLNNWQSSLVFASWWAAVIYRGLG